MPDSTDNQARQDQPSSRRALADQTPLDDDKLGWLCVRIGILAFIFAVIAVPARATYGAQTTADEPQYLMSALSLARDGNLDISDEIRLREFESFHEISLNEQTYDLDETGRRISPHDPLLPIFLAPFVAAGDWKAAKVGLAGISAITAALTVWAAARRLDSNPAVAAGVVALFWAGAPLSAYGTQVYPEMPAALCVVASILLLTRATLDWLAIIGVWLCVVALPWLAVKYALVAAALALVLLFRLLFPDQSEHEDGAPFASRQARIKSAEFKAVASVSLAWLLAGVGYVAIHQKIYGGWTVYSTGDHFVKSGEFSVVGIKPDYVGRSRRLVGLLVDRRFGIATWHPIWFVAPFAMAWALTKFKEYRVMLPVFGAGLITATFIALTMHGWWFPGRQMVVVLPIAVLAVAKLCSEYRLAFAATAVGGIAGAANWIQLVRESSSGRRTLIVDHWDVESLPYRAIYPLMPDALAGGQAPIVGLIVWGLVLVISLVFGVRLAAPGNDLLALARSSCQSSWAARPWRKDI